ncbi:hypothetical protein PsorP6_001200 [Peronosclerospora sorghi]|uniref:Uncharacterized protein n=1 Tax=Peronosclerospora sorghi TaxID=230839 RepID=A0ACC0WWQ7_9STRA|nr:hypothetical protein PsorP6_001200 [Peronosclerospora sorghi]
MEFGIFAVAIQEKGFPLLSAQQMQSKYKGFLKKYKESNAYRGRTGAGLTSRDLQQVINTIGAKLNKIFPCFERMDKFFGTRLSVNPPAILSMGLRISEASQTNEADDENSVSVSPGTFTTEHPVAESDGESSWGTTLVPQGTSMTPMSDSVATSVSKTPNEISSIRQMRRPMRADQIPKEKLSVAKVIQQSFQERNATKEKYFNYKRKIAEEQDKRSDERLKIILQDKREERREKLLLELLKKGKEADEAEAHINRLLE